MRTMRPVRRSHNAPRLPLQPLLDRLWIDAEGEPMTLADLAREMGVSRPRVYVWAETGLDIYTADEVATRMLYLHPSMIWPEWFTIVNKNKEGRDARD
jgi:hypothetical protein